MEVLNLLWQWGVFLQLSQRILQLSMRGEQIDASVMFTFLTQLVVMIQNHSCQNLYSKN